MICAGDYVYYVNSHGDTIPAKVLKVMRVYLWIFDGHSLRKVKISSCELQTQGVV